MIFCSDDIPVTPLEALVSRKRFPHTENLMMVEVRFKKGGVGQTHAHADHDQISYILEGSFEVTVGDEKKIVRKGDGFSVDRNIPHGVVALEDAAILDVFNPIRKDFL